MTLTNASSKFLHYCQHVKNLSTKTIKAYYHDLSCYGLFSGNDRLSTDISREQLYSYINFLHDEGKSGATVKRRIACLKTLFKWLENEEIIELTPFAKFSVVIRVQKRLPRNLSKSELTSLNKTAVKLSGLESTKYNCVFIADKYNHKNINELNIVVLSEVLFSTGVRIGELTSIQVQDIDIPSRFIRIKGKGNKERKVFLPDKATTNLIQGYLSVRLRINPGHNNLFINTRKSPLSTQSARSLIKRLGKEAKIIRKVTPHMYRHSTATQLLESGVDIRFVQQLLGHESIETTQIYTHVEDEALQYHLKSAKIRQRIKSSE